MFGPGDALFGTVAQLSRLLPVLPLIGDGRTRLQPVYVEDVAEAIARMLVDPATAVPQVTCQTGPVTARQAWSWVPDLLDATAFENRFAVEIENDGRPQIRFGDDEFGLSPPDGSFVLATYRVGVGASGSEALGAGSAAPV